MRKSIVAALADSTTPVLRCVGIDSRMSVGGCCLMRQWLVGY